MAKKEKVTMLLKDGVEVHDLDELRANFDLGAIMGYFSDGTLLKWLDDRYYDDEAEMLEELSADTSDLGLKLCEIFKVEPPAEADISMDELDTVNDKKEKLKALTRNEDVVNNAIYTAFNQEDLADLLNEGCKTIYLYGKEFSVSARRIRDTRFIGILDCEPKINIKLNCYAELIEKNIQFRGVKLPKHLLDPAIPMMKHIVEKCIYNMKSWPDKSPTTEYLIDACDQKEKYFSMSNKEIDMYVNVMCKGLYKKDQVLGMCVRYDESKGFAFTEDSFIMLDGDFYQIIKYRDIQEANPVRIGSLPTSCALSINGGPYKTLTHREESSQHIANAIFKIGGVLGIQIDCRKKSRSEFDGNNGNNSNMSMMSALSSMLNLK